MNLLKRPLFFRSLCAACRCILVGAFVHAASAQDALKLLPPSAENAASKPQGLPQDQPYALRWGDLSVLATADFESEWNDNIGLSDSQREQDFILRPKVNVQSVLPLTDVNSFNLSFGLGYEAYTEHSADSRLLITPGSVLSFDFLADDFKINIHDRFSYENDPSLYGNISGIVRIGGLFNTAGLSVSRDLGDFSVTLGFDHLNFISSTAQFKPLNNSSDIGTARLAYRPRPGILVGVESGGGDTVYDERLLSGYDTYSVGAFAEWQAASRLNLTGRAGYLDYQYDTPALTQGRSSLSGYYASLSADAALNEHFSLALQGGHSVNVSVDSGVIEQWYVALSGLCKVVQRGLLTASIRYENAVEPFETPLQDIVIYSPSYERVDARLAFAYPLTKRLEARLAYVFLRKNAAYGIANYTQNDVLLALTYRL